MRKVNQLGEKKTIDIIWSSLEPMPQMPIPFGDDVSAVQLDNDRLAVTKVDMLVGNTDVPPTMSLWQAARKAVVMNISDFAAKGVKPLSILTSIGIPRSFTEEDVRQIGLGLNNGAREYDAYVIGGDTNEASDLIIDCSLFGVCEKRKLVKRSGARPGDIVAVTGSFGKTASGLKILLGGLSVTERVSRPLTESVLMPKARLKEGLALAETMALTASMDSSDGLAWSLYELSDTSRVGFLLSGVPLAPEVIEFAADFHLDPVNLGLYGGEEYELVVTVKPELWEKATEALQEVGSLLINIGMVTKERRIALKRDGKIRPIERRGWEHFSAS